LWGSIRWLDSNSPVSRATTITRSSSTIASTRVRLVQLGITTEEEVLSTIKLASEATPEKWLNGFLLKDLSDAGYSDLESVARVGLFTTVQERATTPNRPSA
jgi:hypothetical protein